MAVPGFTYMGAGGAPPGPGQWWGKEEEQQQSTNAAYGGGVPGLTASMDTTEDSIPGLGRAADAGPSGENGRQNIPPSRNDSLFLERQEGVDWNNHNQGYSYSYNGNGGRSRWGPRKTGGGRYYVV